MTGSATTRLIIIRGNSASGKTTAAWEIRRRFCRGMAIVSQDVIRRDILKQHDDPGNPAIGLMDLTVRYALDHGYHVVLEGILFSQSHAEMLTGLVRDHAGITSCFYYDLSFDQTLVRHQNKPQAAEYGAELMSQWYRERDLIPGLNEQILSADLSLNDAVLQMMHQADLQPNMKED